MLSGADFRGKAVPRLILGRCRCTIRDPECDPMTGRQLLESTLAGRPVDAVACAPIYLSLYCEPIRRRKLAQVYREMAAGRSEFRLSYDDELDALLEANERTYSEFTTRPDWMRVSLGPARGAVEGGRYVSIAENSCIVHSGDPATGTDLEAHYEATHSSSVDMWDEGTTISDETDVERLVPLYQWESRLDDEQGLLADRSLKRWGDDYLLQGHTGTPFWGGYHLLGFAGLMRMVRENPALLEKLFARVMHNRIADIRALAETGLRCLFVEECLTGADMISVQDFERLVWPFLRDTVQAAVDMGMQVVFYFTGEPRGRVEYLGQLAAHALAFEEDKKNIRIDLAEIRSIVGPGKALFGNLDVVMLRDADRTTLAAEIAAEAAAAGSPFVVSMGSPATLDTPPERISWLTEIARELPGPHANC
ncbi:MAG TPA: hypothetical protein DGT21_18510 [Armatimonadetes bacterium]|nr:hypothetical protein [Armatimonadota bacterium]